MSESLISQPDRSDHKPAEVDEMLTMAKDAALRMIRGSKKDADGERRRAVAEKILAKAEIKSGDLEDISTGNINIYKEFKRLGIFIIRDAVAKFDYADEKTGFEMQEGDSYIDLHLPAVPEENRNSQAVEDSLRMIAEFIAIHKIDAKYVMGVTYEKLARLAEKKYGFHIAFPDEKLVPARNISEIYELSKKAGMKGNDMGAPTMVYLTIDELRERVAK